MLIRAIPLNISPRPDAVRNDGVPTEAPKESFIVAGPVVIHTYGYIDSSPAVCDNFVTG